MIRGPPPAPPPAPYPPVQPQQFAAGGPPPHYAWGPGFGHQPMGPHFIPPPPQQLQPAPVFQGFYGPGGAWQPWGGGAPQQRPVQHQQPGAQNTASATTVPAPTTSEEGEQSTPQRAPVEGGHPNPQGQGTPSTPQEAAALAALRRSSPGAPNARIQDSSTNISQPPQTTSASPRAPEPPVPRTTTQATIPAPTPTVPSLSTSTAQQLTPPATTPNRNVNVPSLIPMSFSPGGSGPRPANGPLSGSPIIYRSVPPRHALSGRPLATLPPTLTDAQLAHLDGLTREAIDERLRVLESISSTMYRCVEELTRMRSVLPVSAGPAPPASPATQVRSQPGQGQGPTTSTAVNENAPDNRPNDSDLKSDSLSSNAKPGTDVNGASSNSVRTPAEANGDAAEAPVSGN